MNQLKKRITLHIYPRFCKIHSGAGEARASGAECFRYIQWVTGHVSLI